MLVFVKGQGMIFVAHVIKQSTGHEINFFSESHLAPKFFKVVAFATFNFNFMYLFKEI